MNGPWLFQHNGPVSILSLGIYFWTPLTVPWDLACVSHKVQSLSSLYSTCHSITQLLVFHMSQHIVHKALWNLPNRRNISRLGPICRPAWKPLSPRNMHRRFWSDPMIVAFTVGVGFRFCTDDWWFIAIDLLLCNEIIWTIIMGVVKFKHCTFDSTSASGTWSLSFVVPRGSRHHQSSTLFIPTRSYFRSSKAINTYFYDSM